MNTTSNDPCERISKITSGVFYCILHRDGPSEKLFPSDWGWGKNRTREIIYYLGQIHQKSPELNSSRALFYLGEKFSEGHTPDIGSQGFHASGIFWSVNSSLFKWKPNLSDSSFKYKTFSSLLNLSGNHFRCAFKHNKVPLKRQKPFWKHWLQNETVLHTFKLLLLLWKANLHEMYSHITGPWKCWTLPPFVVRTWGNSSYHTVIQ